LKSFGKAKEIQTGMIGFAHLGQNLSLHPHYTASYQAAAGLIK
jgi:hypothetical protein